MTRESARLSDLVSRRKFVAAAGSAGAAAVAGCSESGGSGDGDSADGDTGGEESSGDGSNSMDSDGSDSGGGGGMDTSVLTGDGSSTVFPITNTAASYWNSNPEAGDGDYWPSEWAEEYGTDMRLADYFASEYGYEATGERSSPPYRVSIALSHSGTGIEGVMEGRVDIGDASSSAASELGEDAEGLDGFVDHVVGVDGQPIVVSPEIADAGVEQITIDDLRGMYKGEITNWSEVGGPDKDILALGRAEGSGTDTAFRNNVYGDPDEPISPDQRFGQNQQLQQAVGQADNAIAYIALAFVEPDGNTPPIGLEIDGTVYEYGKNLGAQEYPLSRDLHAYTYEDTSRKEAAFINFCLSDFGQEIFVAGNNYFKLPADRLEAQREKVAASKYE
ncbi:substrate-binding domain-containing protein [Halomicrobium sp. IBSBa]|uniref:PstS family phosphate ABC transporter substrate-binding protein n=1 Tax=Halomicrobium sp. IBSBa TaxID=2778916 RepID=UPI001ABFEF59|nr:substrate-binding domain-containing protein [Halomicrobium sp. IBSBa]MBO4247348.1 substrate-binding domain-containing protein [Halomicrobium sp. IBSBa]